MSLHLPAALRAEIVAHAREVAPEEACGLIAGHADRAERVIRCRNVAEDKVHRYLIHPEDIARALREMDEGEPFAIYHSHPASAARPSFTDKEDAQRWPDPFCILVSLASDAPEVKAYRIHRDRTVDEVDITE